MTDKFLIFAVSVKDVVKEIKKLSLKKAAQASEIPAKNIKTKGCYFRGIIFACSFTNVLIKVNFYLF